MILFLDYDGVLHPELFADQDREVFCRVDRLWEILRACPEVQVVFSTSWREKFPFDELVDFSTANGGEDLANRFIGATPVIKPEGRDDYRRREIECLAWLDANRDRFPLLKRDKPRWLALDDIAYWYSLPCWNLHLVDYRTGLTEKDVSEVIRKLRAKQHASKL